MPCPILENSGKLTETVHAAGSHSTDLQATEEPEELCAKTKAAAEVWAPIAERLWTDPADPLYDKRYDPMQGMAKTDLERFERLGRERTPLQTDVEDVRVVS